MMKDRTEDIEFAMTHDISRELMDLQPFSKMNYTKRGKAHKRRKYSTIGKSKQNIRLEKIGG